MTRPAIDPVPTGSPWLRSAVVVSAVVHLVVLVGGGAAIGTHDHGWDLADVDVAPPAPQVEALPAELERSPAAGSDELPAVPETAPKVDPGSTAPTAPVGETAGVDAGVVADAAIDARVKPDAAKKKPDAAVVADAETEADGAEPMAGSGSGSGSDLGSGSGSGSDAGSGSGSGSDLGSDSGSGSAILAAGSGSGSGSSSSSGSGSGSGSDQLADGSGSGVGSGMTTDPAVAGATTSAGTAANLLAYFPPGHTITAMIRFDRLRGSEWAPLTEALLRPLPDYRALFGERAANLADSFDTLVISSFNPRDATATTLVGHTAMTRAALRNYLATPTTPVTWSAATGGLVGRRAAPNDPRVFISPFKNWFLLAQPADVPKLLAPRGGSLDTTEATVALPPWLAQIRTIEAESGKARGPALVVTIQAKAKRQKLPELGLGISSVPKPERISVALELIQGGWLLRGNLRFATEADAQEFMTDAESLKKQIGDSYVLKVALRHANVFNAVQGLTLSRAELRVSYATSISVADARALLAATAQQLADYYTPTPADH